MNKHQNKHSEPVNPRRKKRAKSQIFKEVYLPAIIAGAVLVLIIVFIIGAIARGVQKNRAEKEASIQASISILNEQARLAEEEQSLLEQAQLLAADYDYQGAVDLLNTFSGDMGQYPALSAKVSEYEQAKKALVAWNDLQQVPNLSFQTLMADPAQAFRHSVYGNAFNKNFVTVDEFSKMLDQLYANGYILVRMSDFIAEETAADGTVAYSKKTLYLPAGKKPLMLTQTNVNYNIYMVDGDGDKLPDKNGAGFACKLLLDEKGDFTCEMVNRSGETVTGAYDLVPILEDFIEKHPDFSYRGARAVLALTGYNGLFGYRTYIGAEKDFGEDAYNQAVSDATKVARALRDRGYELACYTYGNVAYGEYSTSMLKNDLTQWLTEATPILGPTNMMVFAQKSDITDSEIYSGEKFDTLQSGGFRFYLGFCNNDVLWASVNSNYVRQGRILVTGSNMAYHSDWFDELFDTDTVLDKAIRGSIPA